VDGRQLLPWDYFRVARHSGPNAVMRQPAVTNEDSSTNIRLIGEVGYDRVESFDHGRLPNESSEILKRAYNP
jgi:hypothetical protein